MSYTTFFFIFCKSQLFDRSSYVLHVIGSSHPLMPMSKSDCGKYGLVGKYRGTTFHDLMYVSFIKSLSSSSTTSSSSLLFHRPLHDIHTFFVPSCKTELLSQESHMSHSLTSPSLNSHFSQLIPLPSII